MRGIYNSSIAGEKKRYNRRTLAFGHMPLERHVFYLFECPV